MQNYHSTGQVLTPAPKMDKDSSSLEIYLGEMDNQLSRFFNSLNKLDVLADRLKQNPINQVQSGIVKQEAPPIPSDHCGKFDYQNGVLNTLNNRLEMAVEHLQKAI